MRIFILVAFAAFFIGGSSEVLSGCYPGQFTVAQYQDHLDNYVDPKKGIQLHKLKDVRAFVDVVNEKTSQDFKYPHAVYYFTNELDNTTIIQWVDEDGCVVYQGRTELKQIIQYINARLNT